MVETRDRRDFTRAEAREFLEYDPETGDFTWKVERNSHGGKIYPGRKAGGKNNGYIQIKLFGRIYRAHHLAWLFVTGEWPPVGKDMDHANRDRADNRWANLRLASRSENNINRALSAQNISGCSGVTWNDEIGKWHARITKAGRIHLLGHFEDVNAAIAARKKAENAMYGEFSVHQ